MNKEIERTIDKLVCLGCWMFGLVILYLTTIIPVVTKIDYLFVIIMLGFSFGIAIYNTYCIIPITKRGTSQ